ncbi:hypothetical protein [Paracraurococcus lichenis]|uniref:Uncharacterized protein n=1 Tax=Paracraurococcus lichenis TaxID=3064888 RepID=A0ABT9E7G8_9PROT|nr:hypothetical protein [Paracraurococcus sp. LOR1-02]MDO9712142.1 hypothetical protein [Paracraurococcus sp. LOR1-02]
MLRKAAARTVAAPRNAVFRTFTRAEAASGGDSSDTTPGWAT